MSMNTHTHTQRHTHTHNLLYTCITRKVSENLSLLVWIYHKLLTVRIFEIDRFTGRSRSRMTTHTNLIYSVVTRLLSWTVAFIRVVRKIFHALPSFLTCTVIVALEFCNIRICAQTYAHTDFVPELSCGTLNQYSQTHCFLKTHEFSVYSHLYISGFLYRVQIVRNAIYV